MSGKLLLFGFDSLLHILALEAAVKPFDVELVPVGRTDYSKSLAVLAGLGLALTLFLKVANREKVFS